MKVIFLCIMMTQFAIEMKMAFCDFENGVTISLALAHELVGCFKLQLHCRRWGLANQRVIYCTAFERKFVPCHLQENAKCRKCFLSLCQLTSRH